ncbi:MAG: hypothetical protein IJM18_09625 [Clostridia bacterium]|nr:hypothetical protein [Clostridia bacterium]
MTVTEELFLDALRCALHNEQVSWAKPISGTERLRLFQLASDHNLLPVIVQAVYLSPALSGSERHLNSIKRMARNLTVAQVS